MSSDEPITEADAWEHVRNLLGMVVSLFGLPHQIAALQFLTRKTRAHILQWLLAAEALARRMLLIHAASLPKPNAPPPGKAKRLNMSATHGRPGFADEDSEKWSVSFRITGSLRRVAKTRTGRGRSLSVRPIHARPIAERIEALLRVAANPEPYAQRLARKLHARPDHAARLARPIKWRAGINPAGAMLRETQTIASIAASLFGNSS